MERLISLAAATVAELGPADTVSAAAAGGFGAAGIWFDAATWTDARTAEVRQRLDASGIVALDVEPVLLGPDGDVGDALVDAAIALGARNVLMASYHPDRLHTIERFGQLCDRAAPAGITVVLEFLPIFVVATLADAVEVVRAAARPNGKVLVDSLHLDRSGGSVADVAALDPALFPYLQVADAPAERPDDLRDEALHGRLLPGEGALPLEALVAAVPGVPLSAELRSRTVREAFPDPVDRATAVAAATRRLAGIP